MLVTSWNPMRVWFFEECYLRFGAEDYDINEFYNKFVAFVNINYFRFAHLTNNSIAKYSKKFETSEIEGNMWT